MEGRDVLPQDHELLAGGGLVALALLKLCLHVGLRSLPVGQRLRVHGTLLGGVGHGLLIVALTGLLLGLGGGHLLLQILHEEVHHGHHTTALPALGLVGLRGRRRRRRGNPRVDLHEGDRDASAGDATGSLGGRRGAAVVDEDAVLLGELLLGSFLVELGIVELVHAVLGEQDQLLGSTVAGHEVLVLGVFDLANLGGLCDGLVQLGDALQEGRDLLRRGRDALLRLSDEGLEIRQGSLQGLLLVVRLIELDTAVLLFAFIINLFFLQGHDELIDHRNNLLEADLLAAQSEHDDVNAMAALAHLHMPADLCEHGHCLLALGREGALNLDEAHACARQRFLEKIQSIVIIEDLDGVRQGNDLLRPHLHLFLVDACLRGTICFHSREEFLVLIQRLGAVAEVVLHLRDLHAKRADPPEFLLDGLRQSRNLLLLGGHQLLVGFDGSRLGGHRLLLLREHLVLDRLQDARDFAVLRGVLITLLG
mmetsp:Transcript_142456/g.455376  ORF Transcript_142456/g.455376 Transcript_142456/m.455376 type:complete len:480 (-) Transcript_142456:425-1864(-)